MTVQLTPDQIAERWDDMKEAIKKRNFEADETYLSGAFRALIKGRMQAWLTFDKDTPKGLTITSIETDPAGPRFLLIFLFISFNMTTTLYKEGLETLKTFAREHECSRMSTFVTDRIFMKKLESFGFKYLNHYVGVDI